MLGGLTVGPAMLGSTYHVIHRIIYHVIKEEPHGMRRKLLVLGLAGSLLIGVAPGIALADENPGGCKEFGQFVARAARAPGPYGQTV